MIVDAALSWNAHVEYIHSKVQQRLYFLGKLRSFGLARLLHISKIVGQRLESSFQTEYTKRMLSLAGNITSHPSLFHFI